jgi:hypothetical protein
MAVVFIQEQPEMFRTEMYDSVNAKMGVDDDPPAGLISHTLGRGEDGIWRIVDIWESEEDFKRFDTERLRPALMESFREMGVDPEQMPEPKHLAYETYHVVVPA